VTSSWSIFIQLSRTTAVVSKRRRFENWETQK